jgi:TolB-like protein/Tfp pilus assembly protein PilF
VDVRASSLRHLLSELRRRRVVKVAVAYGAAAFVVAQVSDVVFRAFELPDWSLTLLVVLALAGFPFALLFAWIFDVEPEAVGASTAGPSALESSALESSALASSALGSSTPERPDAVSPGLPAGSAPVPGTAAAATPASRLPVWAFAAVIVLVVIGIGMALRGGMGASQVAAAMTGVEERSLVVLPVRTGSGTPDDDGIVDLVGEEVQARLSRVPGIRVTSWTSALSYRGSGKRVGEIAEDLGVSHVVEITAQRVDGRLRVSAGLVDAGTDRSLWSERYDRQAEDLFGIQGEITGAIVRALELQLTPEEGRRLATPGTTNLEAYELTRRGRQLWMARDAQGYEDLREAEEAAVPLFRRALELDPRYAAPHAGLASYFLYTEDFPFEVRMDSAAFHARRAIELGPHLAEGYVALAQMHGVRGFRDLSAIQLRRALELDPNHVEALGGLAAHHLNRLQVAEAAQLSRRLVLVAPEEAMGQFGLFRVHVMMGDDEGAEVWLRRANEVTPNLFSLSTFAMYRALRGGDREEARRRVDELVEEASELVWSWYWFYDGEIALGNPQAALSWAERMEAAVPEGDAWDTERIGTRIRAAQALWLLGDAAGVDRRLALVERDLPGARARCAGRCLSWSQALVLSLRGRNDEAVATLQAGLEEGWLDFYPSEVNLANNFPTLRDHPGFQDFMAEVRAHLDREREVVLRDS